MCSAEAGEAGAGLEAGEGQLVDDDRGEAGERDLERAVMEQRDAEQRQREQDEVDRDAEDEDRRCGRPRGGAAGGGAAMADEATCKPAAAGAESSHVARLRPQGKARAAVSGS